MVACRMTKSIPEHHPVLLAEVIEGFSLKKEGIYLDATFGRGGHSREILNQLGPHGRLLAMDKDHEALAWANQYFSQDKRFSIYHGSFAEITSFLGRENLFGKLDGILFDLGVSSPQLDNAERGFSFQHNGKLDMRMDVSKGESAATWIAKVSEEELAKILWEYGEERFSRRIARAIVMARQHSPITTTQQLADIVKTAHPAWEKTKHPATRSFQAIRILVNNELKDLQEGLNQALASLKIGGRLLVISFHSLEDRIVKQFIQHHERGDNFPARMPVKQNEFLPRIKRLGRAIHPTAQEILSNQRARSAVLRIAEKQS